MQISYTEDSCSGGRSYLWTAAVLLVSAPLVTILCLTLWRTPFPVSEAVAIFEDVANQPPTRFLIPDTSYYRPLFHMTISAIWHNASSLEARLSWIKLLQIVPVILLLALLIWHLRPRTFLAAAAAAVAVAALVGSPGLRDNLEIPLSYTTVGMPLALMVWILLNRQPRSSHTVSHPNAQARGPHGARLRRGVEMCAVGATVWHQLVIVILTLVAIGFKEQGLVLVPLVVAAWWTRAPGARGWTAATLAAMAVAYAVLRLSWGDSWPMFEQAVGLGFGEMEPPEAVARYGGFPYFIYAYSAASTVANVLFSEPTRGTFSIVRTLVDGHPQPWQLIHLGSSVALSAVIAWWGIGALRSAARRRGPHRARLRDGVERGWSPEARVFVALVVTLLACGALSFNYSRDRLGGMAVPFYAIAAFHALRAAAERALAAPRVRFAIAGIALMLLGAAWHARAIGTVERARLTALNNQTEWLVQLPARRMEFAERATYLHIMETMIGQGTDPTAPRPTRYPRSIARFLGEL